jgi:WD40-like Beta Propeller Repeat
VKRRTAGISVLALALLTACGSSTGTAGPLTKATRPLQASSGSDELVVWQSVTGNPPVRGRRERGAYAETARLWSIRPDGSGARPLEPAPHRPATFVNADRMLKELTRMIKREGRSKALKQLGERSLRAGGIDYAGSFTPDGSHIVFTRLGFHAAIMVQAAIMVVPAAGGSARPLIHDASEPVFSPDGRLLAFDSARDHNGEASGSEDFSRTATDLYVAQADGTHPQRLTHTRSIDELTPTFSPDGRTIAYTHGESSGAAECTSIWEMPASGGRPRPLIADPTCNTWYSDPAWRP